MSQQQLGGVAAVKGGVALDRPKYILTWRLERERKEKKERKREVVNKYIYIYMMLAKYLQKTDYRNIYTYNNHKCWGGGKGERDVLFA